MSKRFGKRAKHRGFSGRFGYLTICERLEPRVLLSVNDDPLSLFVSAGSATVQLTEAETLLLYLVNKTRRFPEAWASRLSVSLPSDQLGPFTPLVVNAPLLDAARLHSEEMLSRDVLSHTGGDGSSPGDRAVRAGYATQYVFENVGYDWNYPTYTADAIAHRMNDGWFTSPGHRANMLTANWTEFGGAFAVRQPPYGTQYATELFGRHDAGPFLTGVVIADADADADYDAGEGLGGVTITAVGSTGSFSTTSQAAGGWLMKVPAGEYLVTASGGTFSGTASAAVAVTASNVQVDFISGRAAGSVNFSPYQNTAPTLDIAGSPTLSPVLVGVSNPAGTRVAGLLGSAVADPDPSSSFGIAVTGTAAGGIGAWQYSIDGGSSWAALTAASPGAALLLRQDDLVRFVPQGGAGGSASLSYRAWDRSVGTAGTTLDTSISGGTSSVSVAVETATTLVMVSNTAPVLLAGGTMRLSDVREDSAVPLGARVAAIIGPAFVDVDAGTLPGIAVTGLTGASNGRWEYSATGDVWTPFIEPSLASAVPLRGGDLVRFVPTKDFNGSAGISFIAWDQAYGTPGAAVDISADSSRGGSTAYGVASRMASVTVASVNDAPRLVADASAFMLRPVPANSSFSGAGTSVASILGNAFRDVDGTSGKGIAVIAKDQSNGTFYFNIARYGGWMYGSVSPDCALLLDAADQVAFVPIPGFSGTATMQLRFWDKTTGSTGFCEADLSAASSYGGETAFGGDVVIATATVGAAGAAPIASFSVVSSPNPGVSSVAVNFTVPVTGVDIADLSLTRGGVAVPLDAATLRGSGSAYVLESLGPLNNTDGSYVLSLNSANSGIASATGVPASGPATVSWTRSTRPANVVGTPGDGQVSLSWSAPPENPAAAVTDYIVQFSLDGGTVWTTFADGVSTVTAVTVTDLTNGAAYLFRVAAVAGGIESGFVQSGSLSPRALPGSPEGLVVTPGNASVTLAWIAPTASGGSTIADYLVEYSSNGGSSWTRFNDGTSASTTATVTGLVNGTACLFRVAAVSGGGQGPFVTSGSVTPLTIPGAPSALVGLAGEGRVSLSWVPPAASGGSPLTDYVVQFSSNNGSTWTVFDDGPSIAPTAAVTGLMNGVAYRFRVAAVNAAGQGSFVQSLATTPRAMPAAPTGLVATPGNARATLTWTAPAVNGGAAVTDYVVQFSVDAGASWSTFGDAISTVTTATVTGLVNGMTHLFRVAAVNGAGQGSTVDSGPVIPFTIPQAPGRIVVKPGNARIAVAWTAPTDQGGSPVTDYVVQCSGDGGASWATFADGVSAKTSAIVLKLANGTPYLVRVSAVNAAGQGAFVQSTPVAPFGPPTAPRGVTVLAGIGRVRVTWTPPAGTGGSPITDYTVQYSSDAGNSWTTFNDGTSTATVATVTRLTNGTTYLFRVAAVNAGGTSRFAESVAIRPRTVPGIPANFIATAGTEGQVFLSWSPPAFDGGAAISDYVVEYGGDSGLSWTVLPDGVSTTTSAVVSGLPRRQNHLFRVAAVNIAGRGGLSTPTSVST